LQLLQHSWQALNEAKVLNCSNVMPVRPRMACMHTLLA